MEPKPAPSPSDNAKIVDARGHRCPVPTLKLRKQMELTAPGGHVILWANDPMAQIDVPHFCNQNNYILTFSEKKDDVWVFNVLRPL